MTKDAEVGRTQDLEPRDVGSLLRLEKAIEQILL